MQAEREFNSKDYYLNLLTQNKFVTLEAAAFIVENFIEGDPSKNVLTYLNNKNIELLEKIIPEEHRSLFLRQEHSSFVVSQLETLEDEGINPFDLRRYTIENNMSLFMENFIQASRDSKFLSWVFPERLSKEPESSKKLAHELLQSGKIKPKHLNIILNHENRDVILDNFEFTQLLSIPNLDLYYLLNRPDIAIYLSYLTRQYDLSTWDQRLRAVDFFLDTKGILGAQDWDINRQILEEYQGPDVIENKFFLLARLRTNHVAIDSLMNSRKYFAPELSQEETARQERRLAIFQTAILEDKHNLLSHLQNKIGFEIEAKETGAYSPQEYEILNHIGIAQGQGGPDYDEVSPGPFRSAETANLVFLRLVQSGIVNMYRDPVGLHIALEYPDTSHADEIGRWMQATGWISNFETATYDLHYQSFETHRNVRTGSKGIDGVNVIDIKDFTLQTASGFTRAMRYLGSINSALLQYTQESKPSMTSDQQKLAEIYGENQSLLWSAFNQGNLAEALSDNARKEVVVRFANHIKKVFPTRWSRYTVNPDKIFISPIVLGDKSFGNLVSASRYLARKTHFEVKTVMDQAQIVGILMLKRIKNMPEGKERDIYTKKFFERYPWRVDIKDSINTLTTSGRLEYLYNLYKL